MKGPEPPTLALGRYPLVWTCEFCEEKVRRSLSIGVKRKLGAAGYEARVDLVVHGGLHRCADPDQVSLFDTA